MHTVRVWDAPTRAFHWLLAGSVIGMVVTAKLGGNWMEWHLRLGHAVLALLVFRLVWGFAGGHWSRFASFVYAPSSVLRYLRGAAPPEVSTLQIWRGAIPFIFLQLLLIVLIVCLNLGAITIRNRLRARFKGASF